MGLWFAQVHFREGREGGEEEEKVHRNLGISKLYKVEPKKAHSLSLEKLKTASSTFLHFYLT